eukprot:10000948-Alexandrium_andersonii.AAC.1
MALESWRPVCYRTALAAWQQQQHKSPLLEAGPLGHAAAPQGLQPGGLLPSCPPLSAHWPDRAEAAEERPDRPHPHPLAACPPGPLADKRVHP